MREGAPAAVGAPTDSDTQSDEALMTAYADGAASAFDVLYERHQGPLYRNFTRQLSESEAND